MTKDQSPGEHQTVFQIDAPKLPSKRWKVVKIVTLVIFTGGFLILALSGGVFAYSQNRILPNVKVAGLDLNGQDRLAATELLQQRFNAMIDAGLDVELYNEVKHLDLRTNVATDPDLVYQLVDWDLNASLDEAMAIGHTGNQIVDFFAPIYYLIVAPVAISPNFVLAETRLDSAFRSAFPNAESDGTPTDFVFVGSGDKMQVTVTEAVEGAVLDTSVALDDLLIDAQDLELDALSLKLVERSAIISKAEAETLIPAALEAVTKAPYTLTFTPEYGADLNYAITGNDLKIWLVPSKDKSGQPILSLDAEAMENFLTPIHDKIDISPKDAKFVVEGNRVVEFSESHDGFLINDDDVLADLISALGTTNTEVAISAERTAPSVPTGSANDLGIQEVLGVGFSSFAGSPSNRRANIKHGADKLNGLLVAPGETLSLLENLRPFTVADGYLPELVIKGDQIIPEVGGGLCQIGTTTFRAGMNSGLDIVERRNHSLVISYYNDPSNGQPGTDATIYDPAPDLKILNDTGHYIMLVTDVDSATSKLTFTFWGTSDGRSGSYTPPVVLSWTGYGATQETETTTLPPGTRKCQSPHPGATATFTYNIIQPDGTTKSREFFSSYRSLPTICLVGVGSTTTPTTGTVQGISDEPIAN